MPSKVFRLEGSFKMGHHWQVFAKEFVAKDEAEARESCYSIFGSKHGVVRRLMKIDKATEVPLDQVVDHVVKHQAEAA